MELFYGQRSGAYVTLTQEDSAHCVRVLRHRAGDAVCVIDGSGCLMECTLTDDNPKGATARIDKITEDFGSHPYNLCMAVCPTKNIDRFEWFAEKATEFGVDTIAPVTGEHSERRTFKTERLERILLSAAKQSLKGKVPELQPVRSVSEFIESASPDTLNLIAYCHGEQRRPITDFLPSPGKPINVLIGPEGDFSQNEIELALSKGFLPVSLGESRLRTETAALAAVAAVYFSQI